MLETMLCEGLIVDLAERYEENPRQFVQLPQPTIDSSAARQMVAELRNEGYVEEEVRGVVRLTPRGYQLYKKRVATAFSDTRWI
jgi:hypothetical protein